MAEELALGEGRHEPAAVEGHERLVGSGAGGVDRSGNLLLAAAGLTGHEDRAVKVGDPVDRLLELANRPGLAMNHAFVRRSRQ